MPPETKRPRCLSTGLNRHVFCEDTALPGSSALPCFPVTKLEKACEAGPNPFRFFPQFKEKESSHVYGNLGFAPLPRAGYGSFQKKLLVFDQPGSQTQFLRCCVFPPQLPSTAALKPVLPADSSNVERFKINDSVPSIGKALLHEKSNENRGNAEETEFHENTEEINALLYSDEEDDSGDCDDEVMSTGHSPLQVKRGYDDKKEVDNFGYPHKRQKNLDGRYNKSSLMDTASSAKSEEPSQKNENTPKSSYTSRHEPGSNLFDKQSRKDKIRTALRILESIVPGVKGKEAISVIDGAIDHLKLLKQNAEHFGVNFC